MSQLYFSELIKGVATYVPGVRAFACRSSGGTLSAPYCYAVWMRHLLKAQAAGLTTTMSTVAELGPGDSLGIGLAAMLTGVDRYYAFDAKPHARSADNLAVFNELVRLFESRAPIPDTTQFPHLSPPLPSYDFPHSLLDEGRMADCLHPERLHTIRRALARQGEPGDRIRIVYVAPWDDADLMEPESIDMVFSQAVLEHVADLEKTYRFLYTWLKPGGVMSHTIDYKSHGLTRDWNGHWTVAGWLWKLVIGKRPYLINRHPHSIQRTTLERCGFRVLNELRRESSSLDRRTLSYDLKNFSEDDLKTSGAFIQAAK